MPGFGLLLLAACLAEVSRAHVQGSPPAPLSPEKVYTSALPGSSTGQMVMLAPNTAVHGTPLPPLPGSAPLALTAPEACGAECVKRGPDCGWFLFCPAQDGCPDPGNGLPLAFQECRLLAADCSLLPDVHATGWPAQMISGFPVRSVPLLVTGFSESPGQGIGGGDFECPLSELPGQCAFNSTLDATTLCIEVAWCRAVMVLLKGTDGCSAPLAVLKSEGLSPANSFVAPAASTLQLTEAANRRAMYLYASEGQVLLPPDSELVELAASSAGASVADGDRWLGCFLGRAIFGGDVLAVEDGVESAEACCRRCRQLAPATPTIAPAAVPQAVPPGSSSAAGGPLPPAPHICNAWNYCPSHTPCSFQDTQGSRELLHLAPWQCQMRHQELAAPSIGWPLAVLAKGKAAGPFLGGAPILVWGPEVPGYQRLIGRGLFTHGRYNCTGSLRPIVQECMKKGTLQEVAAECGVDSQCVGFIMKPGGVLQSVAGVGVFKRDADPAAILFTPTGILYTKDPKPAGGLPAGAIAGIAIGSAAAAVLLSAGAWLAVRRRRRRQAVRLAPAPAAPKDPSPALESGGDALGSSHGGKPLPSLLLAPWVSPFTAAAAVSRAPSEESSGTALELSTKPQRLSEDAGRGRLAPAAGALALTRFGSAPLPQQNCGARAASSRPPLHSAARTGSGPAQPVEGPGAAAGSAALRAPPTPQRSGRQGQIAKRDSPASTGSRTPSFPCLPSRSSTLERAGTLPGLHTASAAAAGGTPGVMSQHSAAVLPELVQHVAEQDADVAAGRGISGLATGSGSGNSEESEHELVRADTLPARLRPWVVDPSAVHYLHLPSGKMHELGSGASARVYKALLNGEVVAAKEILIGQSPQLQQAFLTEAVNLQRLRHPCVVAFHGLSLTSTKGVVLMEFCEGRDLHSALQLTAAGSSQRLFSWYRRGRRVAHDIARALNYLHSRGVVHMDVKSSNVLLTATGSAKLADVAFSRLQTGAYLSDLPLVGTFAWVAPEILLGGQGCTSAVDLFSMGVVLWEVVTGERPQRGHLRPPRVPQECPQEVSDLIAACLLETPAERPTAQALLQQLSRLMDCPGKSRSSSDTSGPGEASRRGRRASEEAMAEPGGAVAEAVDATDSPEAQTVGCLT